MENWLNGLNEQQIEAVKSTNGPLLIIAGAGTGKTKTLTTRVLYILKQGLAKADEILCVTFTNKAAQEMADRIAKLDENLHTLPWLGTFHKIGAKFLRKHISLMGLQANYTILDQADSLKLFKTIDKNAYQILQNYISKYKNLGLLPNEVAIAQYEADYETIKAEYNLLSFPNLKQTYLDYQNLLQKMNCCDFDDLLLLSLKILQQNPNILEHYQNQFKYILADEYQDTNLVQYLFIRLLAQKHENICCVGDDDQAIYSWRGADVKHMLRFEHDFKQAKLIRLERNYRSTTPILNAANGVIQENEKRLGKNLYANNNAIAPEVFVTFYINDKAELEAICNQILNLQYEGHKLQDIAIIVRLRSQLGDFESKLAEYRINYHLIGDFSLYERSEVKDIIAYLRIVSQNSDDLAYERILNTPKRGLGKVSLDKIKTYAYENNLSLYKAGKSVLGDKKLAGKALTSLQFLHKLIEKWKIMSSETPVAKLSQIILDDTDYINKMQNDIMGKQAQNITILLNTMLNENYLLHEYLQNIALSSEHNKNNKDAINLMTIHAAKGLEFKTVFSPAWEENILPFTKKGLLIENQSEIEEERRLAYVVITRAKENLYLSYSQTRFRYGEFYYNQPSRFLHNIK